MDGTKDTLKPTLYKRVPGIIWKILIDEKNYLLAVESRDADNKQVYFSVFDFKNDLVLLKNITLEERWNVSMAHLTGNSLIIKVFPDEKNPLSKGIIVINCKTGNINWEKHNISFQNVWQEGLEVFNPDLHPRRSYLLDIETGNEINESELTEETSSILLPEPGKMDIIPGWLKHGETIGDVLYVQYKGKNFLSFHEKVKDEIQLRLVVYQDDTVLINEILASGIQKLIPEAFFLMQANLFCIKGNNIVISYLV